MSDPKVPTLRLFRYLDATAALLSIQYRALRISRLHELNDPFEWKLGISAPNPSIESLAEWLSDAAIRELTNETGIICFSAVPDESVLWSHYADRHRGIVLEIEAVNDPTKLVKVAYEDVRPNFDAQKMGDLEHMREPVRLLTGRKSKGWAYEQEYRFYEELESSDVRDGHYFKRLELDDLKRVLIGWKSTIEPRYVKRALSIAGFSDVPVLKAVPQANSYKLNFRVT